MPVAPVIAPPDVRAKVGVLIKLLMPVAEEKLIPFIIFKLLFDPAGKLMPLSVLVLFALFALVREILTPFTTTVEPVVLPLVKASVCALALLVCEENV